MLLDVLSFDVVQAFVQQVLPYLMLDSLVFVR
jgi:hypothetical protein